MVKVSSQDVTKKRIGELLVSAGLITKGQLAEALAAQRQHGGKIVETLISLGYLDRQNFMRFLSRQGVPALELSHYEIPPSVVSLVPKDFAIEHEIFPIDKLGHMLTVAMVCPLDGATISELEKRTGMKVKALLCSAEDVRAAINRYYHPSEEEYADHAPHKATHPALDLAARAVPGPDHAPDKAAHPAPSESPVPGNRVSATAQKERDALARLQPELWYVPEPIRGLESSLKLGRVASLVRQLDSLPTLPETVRRVQETANDPNSSAVEVAQVIMSDPPIAAKLLSIVNSAAYGLLQEVKDINLAVALLGLNETCSIVLSAAVVDMMGPTKGAEYRRFWNRALRCARVAKVIAGARGVKRTGGVFSAGLLHDIGQLALLDVIPKEYRGLGKGLAGRDMLVHEEDEIGLTHTEAGYLLAEQWDLPEEIKQSVRFHHRPELAREHGDLVAMIAVADTLAYADGILARECSQAFEILRSSPDLIDEILRTGLGIFDDLDRSPF